MADQATERIHVEASPERCFEAAVDFERYPEWAGEVKAAEILDRDCDGRGQRVRYRISALGKTIHYVLEYDFSDAPTGFSWKLVEADMLRALDGTYRFDDDGDGGTDLTYVLAVDIAFPMPGFMKRTAAGMIVQTALRDFKRYAESGGRG